MYIDLGPYSFTTAPDYTGFNTGFMTSIFNTSVINTQNFECYKLMLDVTSIPTPGSAPMIVQSASKSVNIATSSYSSSVSFPNVTTAGNCLVAVFGCGASYTTTEVLSFAVNAVTTNGTVENWSSATNGSASSYFEPNTRLYLGSGSAIWVDTDTGGGQQVIDFRVTFTQTNITPNDPNNLLNVTILEISNVALSSAVDQNISATLTSPGSASINTGNTSTADEFGILSNMGWIYSSNYPGTQSGTSWGLTNPYTGTYAVANNATSLSNVYGPMLNASQSIVTLLPKEEAVSVEADYTVAVNDRIWDVQTTTTGVATQYQFQQPLYLKTGYEIELFWTNLPSMQYGSYASNFNITAWFRYEI